MKKIYMIPSISVVSLGVQAVCRLNSASGLQMDQNDYGGTAAKENNFSSWDYGFDEEDNSESNSRRKSLWD
jgi:hypothetical protein|uniref:hypothetical protein n=1 Tax=Segatella hominis TaxID=2518605 RepID=UPI0040269E0A